MALQRIQRPRVAAQIPWRNACPVEERRGLGLGPSVMTWGSYLTSGSLLPYLQKRNHGFHLSGALRNTLRSQTGLRLDVQGRSLSSGLPARRLSRGHWPLMGYCPCASPIHPSRTVRVSVFLPWSHSWFPAVGGGLRWGELLSAGVSSCPPRCAPRTSAACGANPQSRTALHSVCWLLNAISFCFVRGSPHMALQKSNGFFPLPLQLGVTTGLSLGQGDEIRSVVALGRHPKRTAGVHPFPSLSLLAGMWIWWLDLGQPHCTFREPWDRRPCMAQQ